MAAAADLAAALQCINTFTGYNCTCGHGFLPHLEANGTEVSAVPSAVQSSAVGGPQCSAVGDWDGGGRAGGGGGWWSRPLLMAGGH